MATGVHPPRFSPINALLSAACLTYVIHALMTLDIPGIHCEDGFAIIQASDWLSTGHLHWVIHHYAGALRFYSMDLVLGLFGRSFEVLHLLALAYSLVAVYLLWRLLRGVIGHPAAEATLILLLTNPLFCMGAKKEFFNEYILMMICLLAGLNGLARYAREGRAAGVFPVFLLFGLGLHVKINFLWYLGGMALFAALRGRALRGYVTRPAVLYALAGFLVGFSPTLFHNVVTGGDTIKFLIDVAMNETSRGHSNAPYLLNLLTRADQLVLFLRGDAGMAQFWGVLQLPRALETALTLKPWLWLMLVLAPWFIRPVRKQLLSQKSSWFWLFVTLPATIFFALPISVSNMVGSHLFMLLPFPQIYAGVLFHLLYNASDRASRCLCVTVLLAAAAFNLATVRVYDREIRRTRGANLAWSNLWPEVVEDLLRRRAYPLYTNAREAAAIVRFMSDDNLRPNPLNDSPEWVAPFSESTLHRELKRYLAVPASSGSPAYLLLKPGQPPKPEDFSRMAARYGREIRCLIGYRNYRNGYAPLSLYEIFKPSGTPSPGPRPTG